MKTVKDKIDMRIFSETREHVFYQVSRNVWAQAQNEIWIPPVIKIQVRNIL